MSDYIKREDAMAHPFANGNYDRENANAEFILGHKSYRDWLESLPAADVRENKHGKWISGAQDFESGKTHECSICGGYIDYTKGGADDYYFCPYCGADMKEG